MFWWSIFFGDFQFDDYYYFYKQAAFHDFFNFSAYLDGNTRPLVYLTFALNYAISGDDIWSYHAINLLIHLTGGLALYGILRRTLLGEKLRPRFEKHAPQLAFVIALLWLLHPVQTMAVTYLWQRCESFGAMWYLLTLYCFIRGREGRGWYALSFLSCLLGMITKETMVFAPLIIFLYDRAFLAGSFRAALRRRYRVHLAHALTLIAFAWVMQNAPTYHKNPAVGFHSIAVTPLDYALTMPQVHLQYLRLAVFPYPLIFDYDIPFVHWATRLSGKDDPPTALYWRPTLRTAITGIVLPAIPIVTLLILTGWTFVRCPVWSFPGTIYFLILAPTSSFMPMPDPIFEYRIYLPLAAILSTLVLGGYCLYGSFVPRLKVLSDNRKRMARIIFGITLSVVLTCGFLTIRRNIDYSNEVVLWQRTVEVSPNKPRAHLGYAQALFRRGYFEKAVGEFNRAIALLPTLQTAYTQKGLALRALNRDAEALVVFKQAIFVFKHTARRDKLTEVYANLGEIYFLRGDYLNARKYTTLALQASPENPLANYTQGRLCLVSHDLQKATAYFRTALKSYPEYAEAQKALRKVELKLLRQQPKPSAQP